MPVIWQLSVIQFESKTLLNGVLLKKRPSLYSHRVSRFKNLLKVLRSYFTPVLSRAALEIKMGEKTFECKTNSSGAFTMVVDEILNEKPELRVKGQTENLEIMQSYPMIYQNTNSTFDVISDIDDTILRSYSSDAFRRVTTLMLTSPYKRKVIGYTRSLFKRFNSMNARVFYVSKSESNLFNLLSSYIHFNKFPEGILFLTSYLNLFQLFTVNKGKDYKLNHIRFIIRNSGSKQFYLLGDDGQRDMEIYQAVANEFPNRIANIFIRQTKAQRSKKQLAMWTKLKEQVPGSVYYRDGDETKSGFETLLDFADQSDKSTEL